MAEALDFKTITVDKQSVPALDQRWIENIDFLTYKAPPIESEDQAAADEWIERADFIKHDLDVLLKMPHHKFWSQVVFDSTLHQCIDSYLHFAPRDHDIVYSMPSELKERQNSLHRLFFLTCLRMATHKESKQSHITPSVFADIVYENFLFDIPKLMDLCVLYGSANGPLLSKMISNIFHQQRKYYDDLRETVPTIIGVLHGIAEKCGVHLGSNTGSPVKLVPNQSNKNPLISMPVSEFQDVIFYISDTANTVWSFLNVYQEGTAKIFMEVDSFIQKIASFYEGVVPAMREAFKSRNWDGTNLKNLLCKKLHQSQVTLIKVFRHIVFQVCLQPLLDSSAVTSSREASHLVEEYLNTISAILNEKRFLAHLNYLYPLREDFDILMQCQYTVDETRLDFIHEAEGEATALYITTASKPRSERKMQASHEPQNDITGSEVQTEPEVAGACAPKVTGVQLQSLITSVKDVLPELGEGFIELCLEELDYNNERVVQAVLEGKLPLSLQNIDQQMARDVCKVSSEVEELESLLDKRLNIYDGDEFDAFSQQIDSSKVILGKKEKAPKSMKELDEGKEELSSLKPLYDKYANEQVESMYEAANFEYEDEYDDTYDSNQVGADDADSADELTNRRLFTTPRVLGRRENSGRRPVESGGSDGDSEEEVKRRDEFVENPEVVRQRQEARRATQRQQREGHKAGRGHQQPKPQHDVVGNPKGQGQEKETTKNRTWKEKNKATRVHHNRKVLADKKRKF